MLTLIGATNPLIRLVAGCHRNSARPIRFRPTRPFDSAFASRIRKADCMNNLTCFFGEAAIMLQPAITPCRLCGGQAVRVFTATILQKYEAGYWECAACGSLQTDPPFWLDEAYQPHCMMQDVGIVQRTQQLALDVPVLLRLLETGDSPSLDWGGGNGLFVRMMRDRGFPFFLHDRYVANHYALGFALEDAGVEHFPVVTAFELLEHLPNPAADLAELFAVAPDVVIITTKVYDGHGPDWFYLSRDNGQHVFFYSLRGLDLIARRYGMRLHTYGDLHVFYRERPRRLAYGSEQLHSLRTTLGNSGIRDSLAQQLAKTHAQAPYAFVERDYAAVLAKLRQGRPPSPAPTPRLRVKVQRSHPKPRIMIDSVFFQIQRSGIARVWTTLLEEWSRTDFARHLVVLDRSGWAPRVDGIEYRMIEPHSYADLAGQRALMQRYAEEEEATLFVSTYYTSPERLPSVLMVYDMIPETLGFDLSDPMWVEKRIAIEQASHYICISENTRNDLARFHPQSAGRTTTAYCGVSPQFHPLPEAERTAIRARLGAADGYYLLAGGLGGHKNGRALINALAGMSPEERLPVLCTSSRDAQTVATEGVDLRFLRVDDDDLRRLYNGAAALIFPSFYEGFGLPLVEAMACGCPVVASDLPIMREVAGDAALFIDPHNPATIADALRRLVAPEVRAGLVAAGLDRARAFSWSEMARRVRETLERVAQEASA